MRRRDLTLLAAIALASPLVTRAQKSVSPMIAFLGSVFRTMGPVCCCVPQGPSRRRLLRAEVIQ